MKRITVILLLCVLLSTILAGCNHAQAESKREKKSPVKEEMTVPDNSEIVKEQEQDEDGKETRKEEELQTDEASGDTSGKVVTGKQSEKAEENVQEEAKINGTTPNDNSSQEVPEPSPEPIPSAPNATAEDVKAVANKVLEYINSYRATPATRLEGLTTYAEYRSRQLVSNFSHSTSDERIAATALQYGTYIDPPLYGMTGAPYYESGAREAIAKGGYVGSVDEVAKWLANLVKNSAGHWAYVGSSEYPYIAVGITYDSDMWYCDIAMARVNTDNN